MREFDAIAVGGGLAGAAFALELARRGARVGVIERTAAPAHKVCGDFLSTEAQALLSHLGLDVVAHGAVRIGKLRLVTGERSATAELPFCAAGLSRLRLDEMLLQKAEEAGAEVIRGEGASALEADGERVRVRVGRTTLTARSAALATGKHNLRGFPRRPSAMTAYKIQVMPPRGALADTVQLAMYRGGYIGACKVEAGAATLCWLADEDLMRRSGGDWRAQLAHLAGQSSAVGDLLSGAHFLSQRPVTVSGIPYGYRRRAVIARNVFPLGDQLCVIPSFTGDGTSLALSSGVAAAQAALAGESAAAFQRAFLARVRGQLLCAKAVDGAIKRAPLRTLGIGAIAALPWVARSIASLTRVRGVAAMIETAERV